jgi:hypothetical protein
MSLSFSKGLGYKCQMKVQVPPYNSVPTMFLGCGCRSLYIAYLCEVSKCWA